MKKLLNLNEADAKKYFMQVESFFNLGLPSYFDFSTVLKEANQKLMNKKLSDYYNPDKNVRLTKLDTVNYKFLFNKDGKYAWRPFQLIHPMVYVDLVNTITEPTAWRFIQKRFSEFKKNKFIICCSDLTVPVIKNKNSIKASSITNWWANYEQESIKLALEYSYVGKTDITGCYDNIYTHSIAWALHTKPIAKQGIGNDSLIGNVIDKKIQSMQYNQTNGIPQGSNLMDFIAEIVLGYADELLSNKLAQNKVNNFKILRYRDDYNIFSNSKEVVEHILKYLSEVLSELNMKINQNKTMISDDIINSSIKSDKLYWNEKKQFLFSMNLQEKLLEINKLAKLYPNSGSLTKALTQLYENDILPLNIARYDNEQLIAILSNILIENPNTTAIISAILSKLLLLSKKTEKELVRKILLKSQKIPNTDYIEIWMQRATIKSDFNSKKMFSAPITQKIYDDKVNIWNSNWLNYPYSENIINNTFLPETERIIPLKEVHIFYEYDN